MNKPTEDVFGEKAASVPVTETPEFKAAMETMRLANEAQIKAIVSSLPTAVPSESSDLLGVMRNAMQEMAMSISDVAYQGNKRDKPVDPKILAARQAGHMRLNALLESTHAVVKAARDAVYDSEEERTAAVRNASPKYRVTSKIVLNEILIDPYRLERNMATPNDIYWLGEPNDAMRPLNDIAKKIHAEFRASRGTRSAIEKASVKPVWMTDNGLIIEGTKIPARRGVSGPIFNDDLDLPAGSNPAAETIPILGTIHEPAVRNYHNKAL